MNFPSKGPLSSRLIPWPELSSHEGTITSLLKEHSGRMACLIHTGGEYMRNVEKYGFELAVEDGSHPRTEDYLNNIRRYLATESGLVLFLGATFSPLADTQTSAIGIDLSSQFGKPVPCIEGAEDLTDRETWKLLIEQLQTKGLETVSPLGGEFAIFKAENRLVSSGMLGCVNGAVEGIRTNVPVEVYPQLCADPYGTDHPKVGVDISHGRYDVHQTNYFW